MAATLEDIRQWLTIASEHGCTYLIIVCDGFNYDDYPIYTMPDDDFWKEYNEHHGVNMQRVIEVYDMGKSVDEQLLEHRAMNCPERKRQDDM